MPLAAHHCNVLRLMINAISQTYPNESLIKLLLTVRNIKELLGEGAGSLSWSYHPKTSGVAFKKLLAAPGLSWVLAFIQISYIKCLRTSPMK